MEKLKLKSQLRSFIQFIYRCKKYNTFKGTVHSSNTWAKSLANGTLMNYECHVHYALIYFTNYKNSNKKVMYKIKFALCPKKNR